MPGLPLAEPEELDLDRQALDRAVAMLASWCAEDRVPGAALSVGRRGRMLRPLFFGRSRPEPGAPALAEDALFLVASITKPVTATAVMMLVERGLITLGDPVARVIPEFAVNGKDEVRLLHLLTHTSGLPDQLPENQKLRMAHRPLEDFVAATCRLPLAFAPGSRVSYQSMGSALLAEIVRRLTDRPLRDFLRDEIFNPLGMADTSLGWQPEKRGRIAVVRVPAVLEKANWNWNSAYWLNFGAPWGGLITSPADFARFCQMTLNQGQLDGVRLLSPATVRAMTSNQLAGMTSVPEEDRRCRPWGLGWCLNWPGRPECFADLLSGRAFGHWGATGTVCWLDPDSGTFMLLFTTQPHEAESRLLSRLCNVVAGAIR